jgi:hypothetical protein
VYNVLFSIPVNKMISLNPMYYLSKVSLFICVISIERSSFMERYFERTAFMDVIRAFMEYIRAFMEYIYKGMHICAESSGQLGIL